MRRFLALGSATALLLASTAGLATPALAAPQPAVCVMDCAVASVPGAPTGLTATPDPASVSAIISWTDPVDTGGSGIRGYPLQRSTDGVHWADYGELAVDVANGNFHDYGLKVGTSYYYRLAAENSTGVGPYSAATSMVAQTYPSNVKSLMAKSGPHSATLSWGAPDDGGTPVTGYQVQYTAATGLPWEVLEENWISAPPATTSPYTLTGLANDTVYAFRVRAVNAQGPSPDWQFTQAYPQAPRFNSFSPTVTKGDGSALHGNTIKPGMEVLVSQSGLQPGAKLRVTLWRARTATEPAHPINVEEVLGTATVDPDGNVRLLTRIPATFPGGEASITSELTYPGSTFLDYTVYFTVSSNGSGTPTPSSPAPVIPTPRASGGAAPAASPKTPAAVPSKSSGSTAIATAAVSTSASAPGDGLAATGMSSQPWLLPAGALLLLLGLAGRLTARRRRA
ncbi:hypothetical protein AL755_20510 [Arthrobacter sp. ERGS1:01]|uniref:fibronectin type III domain-containing protein n=1 Tax=Arthrobacter sp. ERGS1:01 TaxID=1704044 RepID=UPI0006B57C09|nr:fibronectin type III domain-containing protein [Arthrobacter sp. ERGS1:01]ALE07310.1 hypothetical protein AL755_20510 [Arthrobacter sp. ERGS1:01]